MSKITLYYTPFEIYLKYKKMRADNFSKYTAIEILSQLNAVTTGDILLIIDTESAKEKKFGVITYNDMNRANYSTTDYNKRYYFEKN